MPITDNNFTPEEFSGAIAANPELVNVVKGALGANKYVVHAPEEHQEFLKNHEATVVAKKTGEHAKNIEKDVFDLTGIEKQGDEKYYDYMKRAVGQKVGVVAELQKELDQLRAKGGSPNEVDKARIAELEKKVGETEADYKKQLSAKDTELLETRAGIAIEKALSPIRANYKPGIPESVTAIVEDKVRETLLSLARFVDQDGKKVLVFVGEDGQVVIDPATMKAAGPDHFISNSAALKDLIDTGKQQGGTGTGKENQGGTGAGGTGKYTTLPAEVKTKMELTAYLKKLGIMDGSKEFNEIFDRDGKDLPLR